MPTVAQVLNNAVETYVYWQKTPRPGITPEFYIRGYGAIERIARSFCRDAITASEATQMTRMVLENAAEEYGSAGQAGPGCENWKKQELAKAGL